MIPRHPIVLAATSLICAFAGTAIAAAGPTAGDPYQPQEWWLHAIGADQATPPGPGVPITIVDSGVDPTLPEFAGRPNTTFLNDQTDLGMDEWRGAAVASLAAAPANGIGMVGVYPQASLQLWDASPAGSIVSVIAAEGIETAALHCPGVISLGFSSRNPNPFVADAIVDAVHRGCLVVAAAGNDPSYPASQPHVLTVGATDRNDRPAPLAPTSPSVDVAAPGADVAAAVSRALDASGDPSALQGTSFSAPLAAAAAAWVWTERPTLDATQVAQLLRTSARDVGPPGFDTSTGYGILDIPAALAAPAPESDPLEPNDDVSQVKPGLLFDEGEPALTTPERPSIRIAASLDQAEDPRDLYRIWVPPHELVKVSVAADGNAAARIWGPKTVSLDEGVRPRRRDLRGSQIGAGNEGFDAYVEVVLTGRRSSASYVLKVRAATP